MLCPLVILYMICLEIKGVWVDYAFYIIIIKPWITKMRWIIKCFNLVISNISSCNLPYLIIINNTIIDQSSEQVSYIIITYII